MVTSSGARYGVYDERKTYTHVTHYVGPFELEESAKIYADEYTEAWQMGYNGSARPIFIDDKWYAYCSRWTSCD